MLIANSAGECAVFWKRGYPAERDTLVSGYLERSAGDLLLGLQPQPAAGTAHRPRLHGQSALNEMTMVAEGYFAADCIRHINARHKIEMPIAEMVYNVLYQRGFGAQVHERTDIQINLTITWKL